MNKYEILYFDTLDSTNDKAKELGLSGKENTVVIARQQTKGRGRLGRQFFSPDYSGIYMSILLRPDIPPEDITLITPTAAVAVAEALDELFGVNTDIKWVNDIYLNGLKICGILTESTFLNDSFFSVLGIGINLYAPENDFPKELKGIAGAVLSAKPDIAVNKKLITLILEKFDFYYKNLLNREFLKAYREKSLLTGKKVEFLKDGIKQTALVENIDDNAHLIIKTKDGKLKKLFAGEVSVKLKNE